MQEALEFLAAHGYLVIFVTVLLDQLGVPLPSVPILLGAGALAGMGTLHPVPVLVISVGAALMADLFWYWLGKRKGMGILSLLCRISLEPEVCVRKMEEVFAVRGATALLYAKLVPGLATVAPPLAGITGMPLWRFVMLDALGALIWASIFEGLGFAFSNQLEAVAAAATGVGASVGALAGILLVLYVITRWLEYHLMRRHLRTSRIEPEELKALLEGSEDVLILDLRHRVELEVDPRRIKGALRIDMEQLERDVEAHRQTPGIDWTRQIVVYCS